MRLLSGTLLKLCSGDGWLADAAVLVVRVAAASCCLVVVVTCVVVATSGRPGWIGGLTGGGRDTGKDREERREEDGSAHVACEGMMGVWAVHY